MWSNRLSTDSSRDRSLLPIIESHYTYQLQSNQALMMAWLATANQQFQIQKFRKS